MSTGRIDFSDLLETIGAEKMDELVIGGSFIGHVIATLPERQRNMITFTLVEALSAPRERMPDLSRFLIELVANCIGNRQFADWARTEIHNTVN